MSTKVNTTSEISDKQLAALLLRAVENQSLDKALLAAMNRLFESGQWEIPDDAIVGIYAAKIDQMQAMVKAQADLIRQLAAEVRGEKPATTGRVDALDAAHTQLRGSEKKGGKK
jgi:hypothetical protein